MTRRPRPLAAAEDAYAHERTHGATEFQALDVAVREALRLAGRPVPDTARGAHYPRAEDVR